MLDAQAIKAMDGAAKLRALDEFAAIAYPGISNTALAEALGYSRRQIQKWRLVPDTIPHMVLLYLQELAKGGDQGAATQRAMAEVAAKMGEAAASMQALAKQLAR